MRRTLAGAARWGYRAYQAAAAGGLFLAGPYLARRGRVAPREMRERRGFWDPLPEEARGAVWIHAASMGEARGALTLVEALRRRDLPLVMSVMTPAARELEEEARRAGCAALRFVPLDTAPCVRRVLDRIEPRALLICETEVWPGLLVEARRRAVPVAFVSARLTARGAGRQRLWRPVLRGLLEGVPVGAQSSADAARWRAIGADPARLAVTGNLKYHRPVGPLPVEEREAARRGWDHVLVLGSVRSGEFGAVARALATLKRSAAARDRRGHQSQGEPEARGRTYGRILVVVAPRHPDRAGPLWDRLETLGLPVFARHERAGDLLPPADGAGPHAAGAAVLAVHTIGELRRLYALADAAFVGGTLAPIGGHSLYEAAEWGVPVLYGPHVDQVADVAAALEAHGGGRRVAGGEALAHALLAWMADATARRRAAAAALDAARDLGGSAERTLAALSAWGLPIGGRERGGPLGPGAGPQHPSDRRREDGR